MADSVEEFEKDFKPLDNHTDEDEKETKHFLRILNAFRNYRSFSTRRVEVAERSYHSMSKAHQDLIPGFLDHLDTVRECINQNAKIVKLITVDAETIFENRNPVETTINDDDDGDTKDTQPTIGDMDKVKTTLKQIVRDWSEDGQVERDTCYKPVVDEITRRFPLENCDPSTVSVLVPGAGLGRLAYDLAKLGYSCQGNEWSLFMLFASNFLLNKCKELGSYTIHPWVHQWTNNRMPSDQTRPVTFPDVNPTDLPPGVNFSMAAGDFLEVYQDEATWDCLATVFFLDTARNIISYIETVYKLLKPGGFWVNLGPLLYHYADMPGEMSIELSYEDVRNVITQIGFIFEKEEFNKESTYTQNPQSMLKYSYSSVFFVVKKPS